MHCIECVNSNNERCVCNHFTNVIARELTVPPTIYTYINVLYIFLYSRMWTEKNRIENESERRRAQENAQKTHINRFKSYTET